MPRRISVIVLVFVFVSLFIFSESNTPPVLFISGLTQLVFHSGRSVVVHLKNGGANPFNTSVQSLQESVDVENLKKDNAALRSQFQEESIRSSTLLPAKILGFIGPSHTPRIIVIDQGISDGVKTGMAVVFKNILVGKISAVSQHTSEIQTITAPDFSTLAKTLQDNSLGIVHGEDDFLTLDQVVITDSLKNDELIVTRGEIKRLDIGIPEGLVVGKIDSISKVESRPFQSAKLSPLLDYSKLYEVFVMKEL
jgi:rod shape-determining protein MreC